MRIDIEDVLENASQRCQWNRTKLEEIQFYKDGRLINVSTKEKEDFLFMGLSNTDFILLRDWLE